ncbi:RING finger protein [Blumeria hordei DH14]|uniref:RING-type E3 ubiquitin transferase n=1 Tax=Blumeria graminis f. sp. hordei (strain DH14) TaxID=546991 RepID=N1JK71_BLUG1|nr:RING finger protein [Blumeria hordei DH14]
MGFRLAWYVTVSALLAGGVVISAFHQRSNFYSTCVYLAQSNLCLMILINLMLLVYGTLMYSLQRLCFGELRPIEIEQLYEKGWFAVTETCLAMTIFREEVGAWFLVMFVGLLTGKVWGWIGDGRVEILGQQPPSNPRLFHIRLSTSLAISVIYDLIMMKYIISSVIQQARPNMMVMFLFEFTILTTTSLSTAFRYGISLMEASIIKKQTQDLLNERRWVIREERIRILQQREASTASSTENETQTTTQLPSVDDIDETDIDVPGWEAKGQWLLTLDLITGGQIHRSMKIDANKILDFVKLGIYTSFFIVLLMFYGIPIHIIRDLLLTARSCMKRLAAFLRYRRATRDMNARYPDATAEDIQREDTCIICREDMRPWIAVGLQPPGGEAIDGVPPARPTGPINERIRPKKLPCGHILHLGCLKSWLERQQVCPTCRRPVVDPQNQTPGAALGAAPGIGLPPQQPAQQEGIGGQQPVAGRAPGRGMRMLNLGPLRVGFGQANLQDLARELGGPQAGPENAGVGGPRVYGLELGFPRRAQPQQQPASTSNTPPILSLQQQLRILENQIIGEISNLRLTQQEWQLVNLLRAELERIRAIRNGTAEPLSGNISIAQVPPFAPSSSRTIPTPPPRVQTFQPVSTSTIPSGHIDLPPGVTIPEGWSLLPLQSVDRVPSAIPSNSQAEEPSSIPSGTNPDPEKDPNTEPASESTNQTDQPLSTSHVDRDNSRPSVSSPDISKMEITNTSLKKSDIKTNDIEEHAQPIVQKDFNSTHNVEPSQLVSTRPDTEQIPGEKSKSQVLLAPVGETSPKEVCNIEVDGSGKSNGKAPAATVEDTVDDMEQ